MFSDLDRKLCQALCDHPRKHNYRYTQPAQNDLLEILFRSLTNDRADYLASLFPSGFPPSYRLQDAQGVQNLAEYTEAARGRPCGHIFQHGEASYHCMTCADDATSVLCARCFDSSDHEGHQFHISPSAGNSGCCDCGDEEAWKRPVHCAIHTANEASLEDATYEVVLPGDLQQSVRTTISRVLDYFCDVISCSPENLRVPKTVETIRHDEDYSRLGEKYSLKGSDAEPDPEYCLVLWNDEKHTVAEVKMQVARACKERLRFGEVKANEAHHHGRSVVKHSRNLEELIRQAKVIEQIKLTVTIRSSRDTFREQMCGTIIQWLSDIAGCSIFGDSHILRRVICEEMLQQWRVGSEAYHAKVGRNGIDTHGNSEALRIHRIHRSTAHFATWHDIQGAIAAGVQAAGIIIDDHEDEDAGEETRDQDLEGGDEQDQDDEMVDAEAQELADRYLAQHDPEDLVDARAEGEATRTRGERYENGEEADTDPDAEFIDVHEFIATAPEEEAPPSQPARVNNGDSMLSPTESEAGDLIFPDDRNRNFQHVPKTPNQQPRKSQQPTPYHWAVLPPGYTVHRTDVPPYENFSRNIRLDSLILFDLRLWKQTRIELRDLYISTVVNIPEFKRILGLRFSGLYTTLSQLYLVADREPDHSIMNLSLQMLTTPSITREVIERGNFLTNLLAILYTFLTTRQVGYPRDVDPQATLAFETGSVTNRRLIHFFTDLRWYLASAFVQERVRCDKQYLMQYLDLAKLAQGICPNVRAIGEHVEYETDAWINASVLTREINKLCRQFAEAFHVTGGKQRSNHDSIGLAIFNTTCATVINSVGLERTRFEQSEIKAPAKFKWLDKFEFESRPHRVIDFDVEKGAMSFHHPLHYTLSWLLEFANSSSHGLEALIEASSQTIENLSDNRLRSMFTSSEDGLLALFDFPIRVCAWLAQMKAGIWVRNGLSLRHQMYQYTSVGYRDVGHHRDLVLIQTALVTCDPARVLASMIDRFGLDQWMRTKFQSLSDYEEPQVLEIVEDFITLLICLLSDRDALIPLEQDPNPQINAIRKSIIHTLCFKPLTFSDLVARLTERIQDQEQFQEVLDGLTIYKPPEGLHDSGLFELRPEFFAEIDPYNPHFSKNQRDEAETVYKKYMSKRTSKPAEDIVLEPSLRSIQSGAYMSLAHVTRTPLFAQVVFACLVFVQQASPEDSAVSATRIEAFLHVVLQLALIATLEDKDADNAIQDDESFVKNLVSMGTHNAQGEWTTSITALHKICSIDEYSSCRGKIKNLLRHFVQQNESDFTRASANLEFPFGRLDTASPANIDTVDAKKKQAFERTSKVLAQFQQQQQSFMSQHGMLDWDDDEETEDESRQASAEARTWKAPSGVCIHCREETNDARLYGTFGMLVDSHTLRQTDLGDPDFVREALSVPKCLDRERQTDRPFGVSGENHEKVHRLSSDGRDIEIDRQGLGKGWPNNYTMPGLVSTGCGHIMHFTCFETYCSSVARRHSHQIARNHPERLMQREFVCPLCKAIGNTFLPIVFRSVEQSYPAGLAVGRPLELFLDIELPTMEFRQASALHTTETFDHCHSRVVSALATGPWTSTAMLIDKARGNAELPLSPPAAAPLSGADLAPIPDLLNVLARLGTTFHIAQSGKAKHLRRGSGSTSIFRGLLSTLADTITATEIAYRGQNSDYGATLLSSIPAQALSHLQILSSTAETFSATDTWLANPERDKMNRETKGQLFAELFPRTKSNPDLLKMDLDPLLKTDPFRHLTQCSLVLSNFMEISVHNVLRLCYTAEILRVILAYVSQPQGLYAALETINSNRRRGINESVPIAVEIKALRYTVNWIVDQMPPEIGASFPSRSRELLDAGWSDDSALFQLVRCHSLAFLRKAAILMHVSHRVDFPLLSEEESDLPELERLQRLLFLPPVTEILQDLSPYAPHSGVRKLASEWMSHLSWFETQQERENAFSPLASSSLGIRLLHPAPLELIGLPKYYDVLMEESHRRSCPTTGKEITDPALCLFCGEIFCAQAWCCTRDSARGGCNLHVEKCSYPIGIFLIIRKCHILMLHVAPSPKIIDNEREGTTQMSTLIQPSNLTNGSFFHAPYLTKHGETDSGLRSRYQLILNQHRYNKLLRDVWLMANPSSTVWSAIARKLEGDVNAGGWGTL